MNDRLLLDSHLLVWLLFEPNQLKPTTRQVLEEATELFISTASLWELTLKSNKGLLKYAPQTMMKGYKAAGLQLLNVTELHILATTSVKLLHKDPFDTMLIAQAISENMVLLTADVQLLDSPYKTISAAK